ncbi:MAG: hypothetical protein ACOH1K_05270, partial [Rhodoglobus sp.]
MSEPTEREPTAPEPTEPGPTEPESTAPGLAEPGLADGEWHRLHPATPLLRGGIALVAVIGVIIVNARDFFI